MGWPAFGLLMFASYRYVPQRLKQLGAPPPRPKLPSRNLEPPVDVGPVALQRAQPRARAGRDQRRGPHAHLHAVGSSTSSARSAIHTCPNAVGCTWSVITRLRAPKSRRSSTSAPCARAAASMIALASSHRRARARAAEVERDRDHEQPVAARGQRGERDRVVGGEGARVPVRGAHVVDARVQAAEVVARGRSSRGELRRARRRAMRAPSTAWPVYGQRRARAPPTAPTTAARRPTAARRRRS